MEQQLTDFFSMLSGYVWGPPILILLVGTGVYLTFALKGIQFRGLFYSLKLALIDKSSSHKGDGDISHFQALMTALAATVGTGNIAGVATAITLGGPGALFWMWVTGLVGMATKYGEAVLAVKYRETGASGEMNGGPMYYLSRGMGWGWKWLGGLFAILAAVSAFGIGNMVQSNSVADVVNTNFGIPTIVTGIVMAIATGLVILGGIKSISKVTQVLVPFMILVYVTGVSVVLFINISAIPQAFMLVFEHAFSSTAASGGFAGAMVMETMRWGVARGVFSNESGLGSSPIAAAAAKTQNPVQQALVSMTQTFIDTIVVCSFTGFAILSTGVWNNGETGATLTSSAFSSALPGQWGGIIVAVCLMFFAYSTILGWSYYGEKSLVFLFGEKLVFPYRIVFCLFVLLGAIVHLELVWNVADVFNGLMAVPNLIGLIVLSRVIVSETNKHYYKVDS